MLYSISQVQDMLGFSQSTLKTWCSLYAEFLSDAATPPPKRHRSFTSDDLTVLAYVAEETKARRPHEDIYASLQNGQRGHLPPTYIEHSLATTAREQIFMLTARINQLAAEVERLKPYEQENVELRVLLRRAESDIDLANKTIERLNREIGRLEAGRGVIG